jgi:hypothetical protein
MSIINVGNSHHSVEVDPASIQLLRALEYAEHHGAQAQVQDVDEQQRDPALPQETGEQLIYYAYRYCTHVSAVRNKVNFFKRTVNEYLSLQNMCTV